MSRPSAQPMHRGHFLFKGLPAYYVNYTLCSLASGDCGGGLVLSTGQTGWWMDAQFLHSSCPFTCLFAGTLTSTIFCNQGTACYSEVLATFTSALIQVAVS